MNDKKNFEHFSAVNFILRPTVTNILFPLSCVVYHVPTCQFSTRIVRCIGCCRTLHNVIFVVITFKHNYIAYSQIISLN